MWKMWKSGLQLLHIHSKRRSVSARFGQVHEENAKNLLAERFAAARSLRTGLFEFKRCLIWCALCFKQE